MDTIDSIFFPSSGGKPTKAKLLCESCPVKSNCLQQAIELRLEGFYAGTTLTERDTMAQLFNIEQHPLVDLIRDLFPSDKKPKTIRRRVVRNKKYEDTVQYLDDLDGPE